MGGDVPVEAGKVPSILPRLLPVIAIGVAALGFLITYESDEAKRDRLEQNVLTARLEARVCGEPHYVSCEDQYRRLDLAEREWNQFMRQ